MTDPGGQRAPDVPGLLGADPERWNQLKAESEGVNSPEWPIEQVRASEAAARAFWPLGNTRLEKRLPLITAPTLLIWGAEDRIVPRSYADRFAAAIAGRTETQTIPAAGHLAGLDQPAAAFNTAVNRVAEVAIGSVASLIVCGLSPDPADAGAAPAAGLLEPPPLAFWRRDYAARLARWLPGKEPLLLHACRGGLTAVTSAFFQARCSPNDIRSFIRS